MAVRAIFICVYYWMLIVILMCELIVYNVHMQMYMYVIIHLSLSLSLSTLQSLTSANEGRVQEKPDLTSRGAGDSTYKKVPHTHTHTHTHTHAQTHRHTHTHTCTDTHTHTPAQTHTHTHTHSLTHSHQHHYPPIYNYTFICTICKCILFFVSHVPAL